jgi:hypothetical protein
MKTDGQVSERESVRVQLVRAEPAQQEMSFRSPTAVIEGMTSACRDGETWSAESVPWTPDKQNAFVLPPRTNARAFWRITPPSGRVQFIIPGLGLPDPADVRTYLSGHTLLCYLAFHAFAQAHHNARGDYPGAFPWEPTRIGSELLGLKTRRHNGARVLTRTGERDMNEARNKLLLMGVERVGSWRVETTKRGDQNVITEPLLAAYVNDDTGRRWLRHSALVWACLYGKGADYAFTPLGMLRVQSDDAARAVALVRFWRREALRVALQPDAPGFYRATAAELLNELDVDVRALRERYGRAFWTKELERVARAASVGVLGSLSWQGSDPSATTTVTLSPPPWIETAYRPLVGHIERARARSEK